MQSQGPPSLSKVASPIPEYRGHPGPILDNMFAKPPIPKVLSPPPAMAEPPLISPELSYTPEEWREVQQQLDLRAMEQAEEEEEEEEDRRKEEHQKAAAKCKPHQAQQKRTAS